MSHGRVAVLMGGPDAEHDVSVNSGTAVAKALTQAGWTVQSLIIQRLQADEFAGLECDVIFPVVHGPWGEGGPLQALLEEDGRPFVGSRSAAARLCMDKAACKTVARSIGIPTPDWHLLKAGDTCSLQAPVVIKPNDDGSSVDLAMCTTDAARDAAIDTMLSTRRSALAEQWIRGREVTVGVVAGSALPLVEIVPAGGVYDYEAKYLRDDTTYLVDPPLPSSMASMLARQACSLCEALGVRDLARVDYLLDDARGWLLEVNTMPGFTDHSLLPLAAASAGMPMPALCDRLVRLAGASGTE